NFKMATIILVLTPMSIIIALIIVKKSKRFFKMEVQTEGELSGYLEEYISGERVVKIFGHENESVSDFEKINQKYCEVGTKSQFYGNLTNPATRFINGIVYGVVGLVGALLVLSGEPNFTIGTISSFISFANSFGRPFNDISSEISDIQTAFAAAARVFSVLDEEDEPSDSHLPELLDTDGSIEIKDVNFSYLPKVKLIENFNLSVKPGQKIAIVGPTGCGKTTLINLLMRFYDVNSGEIIVSGKNTQEITRSSLRSKFGMVLQESWLFEDTIKKNIAYGNPNIPIEDIIEASKMAGVHDFIMKLKDGYDTVVTAGGANLSQGEKQLICIARIMLLKPPMLILDEATSNIDTRTEMEIQHAFDKIMEGRTSFIVAHRLSTITSADMILVMNKGNVIEQGTHSELLAKRGFYYNLYNSQFAGKTDESV
ncbi:MAG: ABC transporter ATP-binding protein, partial [Clostridia bacterium]|nr:ABC transporter ATP-binding protein [Clostridia bacterium]